MKYVLTRTKTFALDALERGKRNPKTSIAAAVCVALLAVIVLVSGGDEAAAPVVEKKPLVAVASVGALSGDTDALVLVGEVRSVSQAELRIERPGKVTRVNVRAGQYVPAGTILAELENAAERAAVLQAQGTVAAAEAQLSKVRTGARSEDRASASAQATGAATSLTSAQDTARAAYSGAYSAAYDAVYSKADTFFTSQFTVRPNFTVRSATYDERRVVETERAVLNDVLEAWQDRITTLPQNAMLDGALATADAELTRIKAFIDTVGVYVAKQDITSDYSASDKSTDEAVIAAARAALDGARQGVAGARQGLAAAASAQQVASLTESKLITGAEATDIRAAEAAYTQARGILAGASAQLETTLIRTPIPGTVSTLNLTTGGFASAFEVAAVVANPGALEVEAYVSAGARERITVGMPVLVDGRFEGTVTSAAPGLDPATKKARITVGLPKEAEMVNGAFVELAIRESVNATTTPRTADGFEIPITAIKVLPRGLAVFTVSAEGVLEAHEITEGPIVGAKMLIKEGLTPEMRIVVDARGLAEGDAVTIETE